MPAKPIIANPSLLGSKRAARSGIGFRFRGESDGFLARHVETFLCEAVDVVARSTSIRSSAITPICNSWSMSY